MKKLFTMCLVLSMVLMLAAPLSAVAEEQPITLEFWGFYNALEADAWMRYAAEYTATVNPNVVINFTQIPWDDYIGTKLTTAFAAGEGPDVFFTCPPLLARFVAAGVALPLDSYLSDEARADFNPAALAGTTLNGTLYAFPFESELLGLFYNIDVLAEAGIEPPTTWDELVDATGKLATETRAGLSMRVANDSSIVFNYLPFLTEGGGTVFNADLTGSALDSQANYDALQLYHDLMASGGLNLKPSRGNGGDDIGILAEGEAAMQISGTWTITGLENTYPDVNIGVVPYPVKDKTQKTATAAGGWQLVANSRSPYADEAAKFITWLCADTTNCLTDWCTSVKFAYPTRMSIVNENQEIFHKGLRAVFTDQIFGTQVPELRAPAEVYKILQDMIQDAMYASDGVTAAKKGDELLKEFFAFYDGII